MECLLEEPKRKEPEEDQPVPSKSEPGKDKDKDKDEEKKGGGHSALPLSQAIRVGCRDTEPCRCHWIIVSGSKVIKACALGAAMLALDTEEFHRRTVYEAWPWLNQFSPCPACNKLGYRISPPAFGKPDLHLFDYFDVIVHLNDTHRWSRGHIADWVENVEATQ